MSDTAVTWAVEPEVATAIRQRRWVSLVMMILVFGSGTVIGSGLTMIAVNDKYDARLRNPPPCAPHVLSAMQRELDLSDQQSVDVKAILTDHDKAVAKLWTDMRPRFREQLKHLEEQVAGVLTAEQQAKWHAWLEQRRRKVWPSAPHGGRRYGHMEKQPHGHAGFGHGPRHPSGNAGTETKPAADASENGAAESNAAAEIDAAPKNNAASSADDNASIRADDRERQ